MVESYNIGHYLSVAEMPPMGNFVPYAERNPESPLFSRRHPPHFGGMSLIQRFCNKLRLRWQIQKHMKVPSRNTLYHSAEMIMALIFAIIMGASAHQQDRDPAVQRGLPGVDFKLFVRALQGKLKSLSFF